MENRSEHRRHITWMEIISGNKTCVQIVDEGSVRRDVIAIVIGIKAICKTVKNHDIIRV